MDNEAKPDVCPEFRMHDSDAMNEDTLVVQAHAKQATVSTAVSFDDGLSAAGRLCCTDEYVFFQNIKCENEQPEVKKKDSANCQQISSDGVHNEQLEAMHGDSVCSRQISNNDIHIEQSSSDDGRIHTTLNSVDSEIPQFNEHDSVELVLKSDGDERDSNCELPRRWIVCETGVLKAVKAEPIPNVSLTDVDCGMKLDTEQEFSEKNHADILETQGMNIDTKQELSEENHANILETRSHSTQVPFTNHGCLDTRETTGTGSASSGGPTKDDCGLMCAICGKKFKSSNKLMLHERVHTGVKPFTCTTCGRSFSRADVLKVHETVHTGVVKPFTCTTCLKSFRSNSKLRSHERIHTGEKPFTCAQCGQSFARKDVLRAHEVVHTDIKAFSCETCGKSFAQSYSLNKHQLTHSDVKPFKCTTCGKSFVHSYALRAHEIVHTGIRAFTCETCGKSYARSSALNTHKRMHSGVKPFKCTT